MFMVVLLMGLMTLSPSQSDTWHHPLYLGNGGLWKQRIAIVVRNPHNRKHVGTLVTVPVGRGPGEAALAGARVGEIRVCDRQGTEVLFDITDASGVRLRTGRVPDGARLIIPADVESQGEATYYVYFDNPHAWTPPDWLDATGELRNGSVEEGEGDTPTGWVHDAGDSRHIASWTAEDARTGRRSLKLEVLPGSEPTWIATRQSGIRVVGGIRYRMTAWVKAHNVDGYAGWYIHLGNASNPMIQAPMLSAGGGTYGWKEVSLEFTVPEEADRASLGTVLWGTGTAWFDDVSLEPLEPLVTLKAEARNGEKLVVHQPKRDAWWPDTGGRQPARVRIPLQIVNLSSEAVGGFGVAPASVVWRLTRKPLGTAPVAVTREGRRLRHVLLGSSLLFETDVPPRSVVTFHVYPEQERSAAAPVRRGPAPAVPVLYAPNPAVPGGMNQKAVSLDPAEYAGLLASRRNLVSNPSFEQGDPLPADWAGGAEGERSPGTELSVVDGGLFGRRCVRMHIPHGDSLAWTGWRQSVPVKPNRTYLLAAWLRCEDLKGSIQLHVHLRKENGDLVSQHPLQGAGPAITGTTGWTLLSGTFRTPEDCRLFQIHLTMLASGTAWHDGVLLAEVQPCEVLTPEVRRDSAPDFAVWSVNPIVKVFREDLPPSPLPAGSRAVRISCAGNEYEPIQIAMRSAVSRPGVRVIVDAPRSTAGRALGTWEIGVVRYVPVDTVTNYYSDRTPGHVRKIPRGPAGSDGWPGWWPDPIIPGDRFDLPAHQTVPVWLTLYVPAGTPAGEYRGAIRLVHSGRTLATFPLVVTVWSFSLPDRPSLKAIYDVRQSGAMWRVTGKSEQQVREDLWRFMARRRLCPDVIRPEPVLQYRDGQVIADLTEFDRAAHVYFDELKFPHAYTPWHFYLFGWGHPPGDKFGEKPYEGTYPYEGVDRGQLRPEFRRAYQACLKVFWDHIKSRGWADRFVLYISDEPHDSRPEIVAQMKALCDMIHEVDPTIPIYSSTWHHQPAWDGKLDVWGIGHYGIVSVEKMMELRQSGARIWWTTDGQMCTDTPFCAIERLLPHYCFKYGAEAYEFWGVDWLTYDPYEYGWHAFLIHDFGGGLEKEFVRYPNGDGFLAYPPGPLKLDRPVPSIRLEQAREGVEDYEYLVMLRRLVEEARAAGQDVRAGEQALKQADDLVESPCEIGRYSTRILPDPDRVLRVRQIVGQAIERLLRMTGGSQRH